MRNLSLQTVLNRANRFLKAPTLWPAAKRQSGLVMSSLFLPLRNIRLRQPMAVKLSSSGKQHPVSNLSIKHLKKYFMWYRSFQTRSVTKRERVDLRVLQSEPLAHVSNRNRLKTIRFCLCYLSTAMITTKAKSNTWKRAHLTSQLTVHHQGAAGSN